MSAMGNILVKDDDTAAEFTLVPITDTPNPFWRANASGIPYSGQVRCTMSSDTQSNGTVKSTLKLEVPVMETLGASGTSSGYVAPPKVAYVTTCIFSMFFDQRSTIADRANALKMAVGILQGAGATTGSGTLSNTAAADAWANSVLLGPTFFIQGVVPN